MSLFSVGLIPSSSSVYLILKRGNYYYNGYLTGNKLTFKSLDPAISTPALFTYVSNVNGTILSINGLYLNLDGTTLQETVVYHKFLSPEHNMTDNTIYGGLYYQTGFFNPVLNDLNPTITSVPFGGALTTTFFGGTSLTIQFIPSILPIIDGGFPTVYQYIQGDCKSPTTIDFLLSDWMKGSFISCITGKTEGCIFTSEKMCDTSYVPSYCITGQNCGNCLGKCPSGVTSTTGCVYDYDNTEVPFYSCTPENPEPKPIDSYIKYIVITIAIIIALILIFVIIIAAIKNKS